jgi:aminopeptidase N
MMQAKLILFCLLCWSFRLTAQVPNYDASWRMDLEKEHKNRNNEPAHRTIASSEIDVHYYRCSWELNPAVKYLKGAVTVSFLTKAEISSIQLDLNTSLLVDSILYRNRKISFQQQAPQTLFISLPNPLPASLADSIRIFYQGVPAEGDFGSFVQMTKANGVPVIWTLSQPYGSKDWWPCKNGQQDKADSIDIEITHPAIYQAVANGLQWKRIEQGALATTYWRHRYPISTYLVAIAVSNYRQFDDSVVLSNRPLPMKLYAYQETGNGLNFSMQTAKRAMTLFHQQVGEYPFWKEGYSQTQFSRGGGMEHQTNSFIERNNTDLVVHELFHQWFGDKVTCNSWEDVWLNEGFATYAHYLYMEQYDTARKIPHLDYLNALICSEPGGSLRVRDTTQASIIFDFRLSYCKGSALLHMLRWSIGDTAFFQSLRRYHQEPALAFKTSRTKDFQRIAEQASGQSLSTFFNQWFEKEGHPSYQIQWWNQPNGKVACIIKQTSSHPSVPFFEMPLPLYLSNGQADTTIRVKHQFSGQKFVFTPGFKPNTFLFDPKRWLIAKEVSIQQIDPPSEEPSELVLYPIPAPNQLNMIWKSPRGKQLQVAIYNAQGQLVYQQQRPHDGSDWVLQIPTQRWKAGIYWLRTISDGNLQQVKKWIR